MGQAMEDFGGDAYSLRIGRLAGFGVAGNALFAYLLARYGVRGILDIRRPWRALGLVLFATLGLLGGFRSVLILYAMLFGIQFFLEGLHRTRMMPVLLAGALVVGMAVVPFTNKLPLPIQRCLSILPVNVNPAVRADAAGSTEWRLQMRKAIAPEIPKHFWVGKGYTASAADYYLTTQAMRMGLLRDFEGSMIAGDYHNGPLSLIIPFGIWGLLAFLFFIGASLHVLIRNYRHGDPEVQHINTFLLAFFLTRVVFFFSVFGAIHSDISILAGLVAFSISLNGGVCRARIPAGANRGPAPELAARAHPRRWMPVRS
jgi:O-antigen ligase